MNNKGFMGMIGLLLTAVIVCFLAYISFTQYFGKPSEHMDKPTQKMAADAGIDTSSQQAVLESTKAKIKDIEAMELKREDQLMNSLNQY